MYLTLAAIKSNGNIASPKNIIPWILKNEQDELICYFKELEPQILDVKSKLDKEYELLKNIWELSYKIKDRKEFALNIVGKTKFTGLLFTLKDKYDTLQTEKDLKDIWNHSDNLIVKMLFKDK
jgi:hypothetical protein